MKAEPSNVVESNPSPPKTYSSTIFSSVKSLPQQFVSGVQELEAALGMPVWLLVQNDGGGLHGHLWGYTYKTFFHQREQLPQDEPIALLIDSPGGDSASAYKLARLLQKRCGSFIALVPSYAKSAATLLVLGAERIVLGTYAELGPLDMQVKDDEGEEMVSALNYVQTLERLGAYSKRTFDEAMFLFIERTRKKTGFILPHAIDYTSRIVRPLMENVDVLRYTEMSRILKIGRDYAERLLTGKYSDKQASKIASALVSNYPEHGFVIDKDEAAAIGLTVETPDEEISRAFEKLLPYVDELTVLGQLQEKQV